MKSLITFIVLVCVVSSNAQVFVKKKQIASAGVAASGGGCDGTTNIYDAPVAWDNGHDNTFYTWYGEKFTTTNAFTACTLVIYVNRLGSPGGTIRASIYTDNANKPGTLVGSWSATQNCSSIGTSVDFNGVFSISATLSSSTVYWVVINTSQAGTAGNYIQWIGKAGVAWARLRGSTDGSTWDDLSTENMYFYIKQ